MPNPTEQVDAVREARELLVDFPEIADAAYNVEHALFADVIERQRNSPFWGHSKKIAKLYARAPELLKTLADEVERLRKQVKEMERDAREDAQSAATESYWQERQGEDYGSY